MKKLYFITLVLAALMLAGCQREASQEMEGLREIKFTASMEGVTKATATAFEDGDRIGLTIGEPVNKDNVVLLPDGESLTAEHALYWPADMSVNEEALFIAYYPYEFSETAYGGFVATDTWAAGTAGNKYCFHFIIILISTLLAQDKKILYGHKIPS